MIGPLRCLRGAATMKDWFINKIRDSRVWLTIKDLKSDVDTADSKRRAKILFTAQVYRLQLTSRTEIDAEVFRNPQNYPRSFRMDFVGGLEEVIFDGEKQVNAAVERLKADGMNGNQLRATMLINKRAVQVWIATLGAKENQESSVKDIWWKLLGSRASLSATDMVDPGEVVQLKQMTEASLSFVPTKYQLA